jgi:hypothetical protein
MDLPVLKYIDILIGLSLVMVLLSTIVLSITQTALAWVFARPRHLRRGLERLINQLEPETLRPHSPYLARLLLRHPLIGQWTVLSYVRGLREAWKMRLPRTRSSLDEGGPDDAPTIASEPDVAVVVANVETLEPARKMILPPLSAGSVIQREELAYLLIELAAGEGPLMDPMDTGITPPSVSAAQQALAGALRRNGVEDPAATLRAIRAKVVQNERAQPDLPARRWRSDAVADAAPCDFVARLHASFDNTMARVTDAFSGESRLWVVVASLVVVVGLQFDTFAFVKRLSVNDQDRAAFVTAAQARVASTTDTDAKAALEREVALLQSPALNLWPALETADPTGTFGAYGPYLPDRDQIPGVLFSWVLLSLGAPFWFDALKNLLKLRSVLAKQDDKDRQARQATPATETKTQLVVTVPAPGADEAGDLTATGVAG